MYIEHIEFKNLFAYGEKLQILDYSSTGKLILLTGKSGVGKSAILSIPCLLLYGKLDKVPKNAVANRINKNGYIKGIVNKGKTKYEITRTFMPNSITILKDGQDISNFGIKDGQEYIENEIIEMPQAVFSNMISVSMKKFKSFLTMSPADRKQIIDRVFSLEVVNCVFDKLRTDLRALGNEMNTYNATIFSLNNTRNNSINEMQRLQESLVSKENQGKVEEYKASIVEMQNKLVALQDAYNQANAQYQEISNQIQGHNRKKLSIEYDCSTLNQKLALFNQDKCPTCGNDFKTEHYDSIKEDLNKLLSEKQDEISKIADLMSELNNKLAYIQQYCSQIIKTNQEFTSKINSFNLEITKIESAIKSSSEFQAIQNIIQNTENEIRDINIKILETNVKIRDLQLLSAVYSIDGVKQKVISNYLPILNKEITENLLRVNFPYSIVFDEKFDYNLSDLGTKVPVETLSDGEMARVDVVILCSLFKLLKRIYPSINLFSCDELLSSLDADTAEYVLKYLKEFAKEMQLNMFIVSHVQFSTDYFDTLMEVSRNKGFSEISTTVFSN